MRFLFDHLLLAAILLLPLLAWFLLGSPTTGTLPGTGDTPSPVVEPRVDPGAGEETPGVAEIPIGEVPADAGTEQRWLLRTFGSDGSVVSGKPLPLAIGDGSRISSGREGVSEIEVSSSERLQMLLAGDTRLPILLPEKSGELDCIVFDSPPRNVPVSVRFIGFARPFDSEFPGRLFISGETSLPAGTQVRINVTALGRNLDGGIAAVDGPDFSWDSMTSPRNWFGGEYRLRISWRPSGASPEVIREVARLHGEVTGGEDWICEYRLPVGDPATARRQRQEIEEYYSEALKEVTRSRDLLLVAGARARGKRSKLLRDPDRVEEMEAHPFAEDLLTLGRKEKFAFARWRQLIDEKLPQRWQVMGNPDIIPYSEKHPGAARNLQLLFATLYKYARLESTVAYEALGLKRHENDFVANFDWGPETERKQVLERLRNYIDAIEEAVNLDD